MAKQAKRTSFERPDITEPFFHFDIAQGLAFYQDFCTSAFGRAFGGALRHATQQSGKTLFSYYTTNPVDMYRGLPRRRSHPPQNGF